MRKHNGTPRASLTIYDADITTERGKKAIATWLRKQAKDLLKQGGSYAPKFRSLFYFPTRREQAKHK